MSSRLKYILYTGILRYIIFKHIFILSYDKYVLISFFSQYPDFPSAAQESDGLAVAGFFLQVYLDTVAGLFLQVYIDTIAVSWYFLQVYLDTVAVFFLRVYLDSRYCSSSLVFSPNIQQILQQSSFSRYTQKLQQQQGSFSRYTQILQQQQGIFSRYTQILQQGSFSRYTQIVDTVAVAWYFLQIYNRYCSRVLSPGIPRYFSSSRVLSPNIQQYSLQYLTILGFQPDKC